MIRPLLLTLTLTTPLAAQTLPAFSGDWQGEGALTLGAEPEQRFQCRLRFTPLEPQGAAARSQFVGRCATAQGSQSVNYTLIEAQDGTLTAEARSTPEGELPDTLQGEASGGGLTLRGTETARLSLQPEGDSLRFTLEGHDSRGPARGTALLQRRE